EPPPTTPEDLDALRFLPPRQLQALALTYGLNDDGPRTSETVGKLMGCSAQNVRGLALNALARLRKRMGVARTGE
ncbi:sigma factor-like helix-turn-helix DNA-binding protein, partial [Zavarzinella formosa]|uniref:sigma factor-like helix-turn-helix DNA-binding protein n=1 Tax=Zavarzinella formosa TaxID=360055 RepID=UPI00049748DF